MRQRPGRVQWSNANVNENFPDPISPLLYSIASAGYYHYFRNLGESFGISRSRLEAMEQPLRHIIGVHGGRMYYNLTSIHAVLRSAPCGELLTSSFNQFVGSDATDTAAAVPLAQRAADRARQAAEVTRVVFQTIRQYASVERRVERFERRIDAFATPHTSRGASTANAPGSARGLQSISPDPLSTVERCRPRGCRVDGLLRRAAASARPGLSGRGSAGAAQFTPQGSARPGERAASHRALDTVGAGPIESRVVAALRLGGPVGCPGCGRPRRTILRIQTSRWRDFGSSGVSGAPAS